jgi:uncharacterized protein YidB (DUF937 family)
MSQFDDLLKGLGGQSGGKKGGLGGLLGGLLGGKRGGGSGGGAGNLAMLAPVLLPVLAKLLSGGGLQRILAGAKQQGLGDKANSWVGTGENKQVSPDELRRAVGDDTIREAAAQAGVSEDEAAAGLATLLPQVVDRMTPAGQVPDEAEVDAAAAELERAARSRSA